MSNLNWDYPIPPNLLGMVSSWVTFILASYRRSKGLVIVNDAILFFFSCTAFYRLEKFRETGSRPRIFRFIQLRHASRSQRPLLGKTLVLWKCLLLVTDPKAAITGMEREAHEELRDQSWITRRLKKGDETWVLETNNSHTVWLVSRVDPWSPDLLAMSEQAAAREGGNKLNYRFALSIHHLSWESRAMPCAYPRSLDPLAVSEKGSARKTAELQVRFIHSQSGWEIKSWKLITFDQGSFLLYQTKFKIPKGSKLCENTSGNTPNN